MDLGYCRPATFHRHEGRFTVALTTGESITVSGEASAELPETLSRIPGLQRALDFRLLVKTPQFEVDNTTPLRGGYQGTMVEYAIAKLDELRLRMPNAGGLVIAPDIEMAEYMCTLIEMLDGEKPGIVHSKVPNPGNRIKAFKSTDKRWLVSVGMVSEGGYSALEGIVVFAQCDDWLAFRQAVGRVVRTQGVDDDTRAYVVMPNLSSSMLTLGEWKMRCPQVPLVLVVHLDTSDAQIAAMSVGCQISIAMFVGTSFRHGQSLQGPARTVRP